MSDSGRIWLDETVVRYRSKTHGDWDVPLSEVRIIGECTNQLGPFADDYFFCFATSLGTWFEASFYAEGTDDFLDELSAKLGGPFTPGLSASTDFASRVLWPAELAGEPMFQYTDLPPKGPFAKLFGARHNVQTYTERTAALLAGEAPPSVDRDDGLD